MQSHKLSSPALIFEVDVMLRSKGRPPELLHDVAAKGQGIHKGTHDGTALLAPYSQKWQAFQQQVVQISHCCHSCGGAAAAAEQLCDESALCQGP